MADKDPKREKQWAEALAAARARSKAWRKMVDECERARDLAVDSLHACAQGMGEMIASGEIGSRKAEDGQSYPQLRVVYWGEIESGSMSLACIEVDYGFGDKARVGVWGRLRAVWDCAGLSGPKERALAWVAGWGLGSQGRNEKTWMEVKACLRSMSMDLDLDLKFGQQLSEATDEGAWDEWLAKEGSAVQPLATVTFAIGEDPEAPSSQEWADLGRQATGILESFKTERRGPAQDAAGESGAPEQE